MTTSKFIIFKVIDDSHSIIKNKPITLDLSDKDKVLESLKDMVNMHNQHTNDFYAKCEITMPNHDKLEYNSHYDPHFVFETKFGHMISKHKI